eukprot:756862-Hanusia_phi.AAC.5
MRSSERILAFFQHCFFILFVPFELFLQVSPRQVRTFETDTRKALFSALTDEHGDLHFCPRSFLPSLHLSLPPSLRHASPAH